MADLTITESDVISGSGAVTETGTSGAAITQGSLVYKDPNDSNKWKLAQCDGTDEEAGKNGFGIALTAAAAADQPVVVQTSGDIALGSVVSVGELYVSSATAGKIAPFGDLVSGNKVSIFGVGKTGTTIGIINQVTGVVKA